jgi:hypothetical protein
MAVWNLMPSAPAATRGNSADTRIFHSGEDDFAEASLRSSKKADGLSSVVQSYLPEPMDLITAETWFNLP